MTRAQQLWLLGLLAWAWAGCEVRPASPSQEECAPCAAASAPAVPPVVASAPVAASVPVIVAPVSAPVLPVAGGAPPALRPKTKALGTRVDPFAPEAPAGKDPDALRDPFTKNASPARPARPSTSSDTVNPWGEPPRRDPPARPSKTPPTESTLVDPFQSR